jgi:hypothetical protein
MTFRCTVGYSVAIHLKGQGNGANFYRARVTSSASSRRRRADDTRLVRTRRHVPRIIWHAASAQCYTVPLRSALPRATSWPPRRLRSGHGAHSPWELCCLEAEHAHATGIGHCSYLVGVSAIGLGSELGLGLVSELGLRLGLGLGAGLGLGLGVGARVS